jgi:hypothetical protein
MRTMNNNKGGSSSGPSYDYFPTGDYANMAGYVGESLMGDPTLRLHPVAPPESVAVEKQGAAAVLIWEPSPDAAVSAYHVYSSTNRLGPYTRLTAAPIASLTFTHVVPPASDVYYQVCAVKRELTPATVYTNASQGVFAQLDADGTANWAPTADGTNLATSVDQFLSIPLGGTDPDGDALTPVVTRNPTNGELRWNGTQVVYVPKIGYSGDDSVRYAMSDGVTLSAPAIVDIVVSPNRNLIEWEFGSPLNTVPQNLGSTTNATGILPATVTLGSALSLSTDLAIFQNDAICLSGTPVGGLNSNGYLEWIVAPETLHRMSLSRVSLGLWNNDSAKPLSAELRWSDDGFSTWQTIPLGSEPATYAGNYYDDNAGMPFTGSLADVDELQNLTHAVTFRLYVWHGTSSSVCGIGKLGAVRTDLAIAGSVLSIAPPVVTSAAQAEGRLGEPFEYTITADNDPTGFGASGLPSWASIDSGTGVISGTPDAAGVSPVLLSATNAWGTGTASLEIVVGCVIEATSGEGGMIAPSGRIGVAEGASQAFAITPGPYALIGDVLVDGVSVGAVAQYTFADVQSNHTIHAEFAELLTTHGTPYAWLADLGYTGDFEAADLDDLDGDGVPNWIEHRDETDPADPLSRPAYNTVPYAEAFENLAGWGRVHTNVVGRMGWSSDIGAADHSRIVPAAYAYAAGTPPLPAATHTNVLELETSGGALSCDFGEGFTMAGGMAYVDLLAQAARCEATPEQYGPGDVGSKAGAYVDAEGWICVHHGVAAPDGSWLSNAVSRTAFQVGAEDWFRLTVAIDATLGAGHPTMFQARVNGVVVTNGAAYAEGWKEAYLGTGMLPAPSAEGSWFRTATADAAETLLRAVAFTGNGSVDDLVVGTADPFAAGPGTCLLVVRRSGNGTTSLGGSELASVEVPFGSATQVVYAAADWHRIASLETDGAAVPAASGLAVHTQVFASVTANVSNDVAFALATPEQTGHANVPTAWLANWTEAAVAAAPADGYDVEAKYLLGLDPTASNTYALAVESLELRGPEAVAVARRHVTGPLSPDGMHGNLVLQHAGDLGAGFTNLPGATVTGPEAFDGEGRRAFTNAIPEGAATGFFRAAVQPGE